MSHFIELSTKSFEEASKINGKNEFCFIIGEQKIYCHQFVAAFISRKVNRNLLSDPTMNTFHVELRIDESKSMYIEDVVAFVQKLIKGQRIQIDEEKIKQMKEEIKNIAKSKNPKDYFNTLLSSYLVLINELENDEIEQQFYTLLFSKQNIKQENQANASQSKKNAKEEINQKLQTLEEIEAFFNMIEHFGDKKSKKAINKENIIKIISDYFNEEYSTFISQAASHFYEIEDETINNVSSLVLNDILNNHDFKIKDEDTLLNTLLQRRSSHFQDQKVLDDDEEFFIEKVNFEYLSTKGIEKFLNEIHFSEISEELWSSICKRLVLPVQVKTANKRSLSQLPQISQTFSYKENNKFSGILNHLNEITKGNIQTNGTIEITCSDFCCGSYESIVDFNNKSDTYLHVRCSPGWVQINLKSRIIQIDSYLIKSSTRSDPIKSFRVEISDNGSQWDKIDENCNVTELRDGNRIKLFKVQMTKPFSFIKFAVNESYSSGSDFDIGRIELYGNILQ